MGRKLGMTQVFGEDGQVVPVTVIEAGPCVVVQRKTLQNDGYEAIQLGFGDVKPKNVNRPMMGHFRRHGVKPFRWLREFRFSGASSYEEGSTLDVSIFSPGERVDVSGISKGKGFQGAMKRHGFSGGPASHGTSLAHRAPSSIGCRSYPGKIHKGKRMAGHMGSEKVTVKNLEVVGVHPENNLLLVRGAVPGARNSLVLIYKKA